MDEEKAHAFMPMTRALLSQWVVPFSKDAVSERSAAHAGFGALGFYFWIIPMLALDMLFTPILLFGWLRGDKDVCF